MTSFELDIEVEAQLLRYLRDTNRIERDGQPRISILTGGVSNRAVLVESARESLVIKQALEKLRVAVDWYSDPKRIFREAAALRALESLLPPGSTPHFLFEDADAQLFAMTAVPQPAENWKTVLLSGRIEQNCIESFGSMLGTIHRLAYERDGDMHLSAAFGDRSLFESLRVEPYYAYTALNEPDARGFISALIDDVRANALTFVHGDYSPKNVLVHNERLVLLDYEVAHWGDPAFDVGFGLTHLLSKAHHLPGLRTQFATASRTMWRSYRNEVASLSWVDGLEKRSVRHAMACLLARVSGRSPLEYLLPSQRSAQRAAVIALLGEPPTNVDELIDRFLEAV